MGNSASGAQRSATTSRARAVAPPARRGLGQRLREALQRLRGRLANR